MENKISPKEEHSDRQPWLPHHEFIVSHAGEELSRALKQAGRYKSPLSFSEKLKANLQQKLQAFLEADDELLFHEPGYPVPLEWQVIIQYLFEQGILQEPRIQFENLFNDEPKIHMLRLWANSIENLTDGGNDPSRGGYSRGVSQNLQEAISKVIGELLERYPLTIYREKNFIRSSIRSLKKAGDHFLDPTRVAPFSEEQKLRFPNRRFDEQSTFRWVRGNSLMTGKTAYIPAQLVYWNYRHSPEEPFIQQPITNGAGGMFTLTEAILAGIYELVQRDAFFIYWFNKIPPPRIDQDSIGDPDFKKLLANLKRYRIELEILDITSDFGIPAFAGVLIESSGKGPAISIGAGCGRNPERAIIRAVTEAMGVRHWLRQNLNNFTSLPELYKPFIDPLSQEKRLLLWGNPLMRHKFDFFLCGPKTPLSVRHPHRPEEDPREELQDLKEKFQTRGESYEIFYYEAKHPVLERLGYYSVSVSVPALLPLYLNETCAPLGSKRIQESCILLGLTPSEEINDLPHPFP